MRDTSYPKPMVKIDYVWYEVKKIDYITQQVTIKKDGVLEELSFGKIEQWTTVWEG
jgi:hypothetical protein